MKKWISNLLFSHSLQFPYILVTANCFLHITSSFRHCTLSIRVYLDYCPLSPLPGKLLLIPRMYSLCSLIKQFLVSGLIDNVGLIEPRSSLGEKSLGSFPQLLTQSRPSINPCKINNKHLYSSFYLAKNFTRVSLKCENCR